MTFRAWCISLGHVLREARQSHCFRRMVRMLLLCAQSPLMHVNAKLGTDNLPRFRSRVLRHPLQSASHREGLSLSYCKPDLVNEPLNSATKLVALTYSSRGQDVAGSV